MQEILHRRDTGAVSNRKILADSGEGYKTQQECVKDIERVKTSATAPVIEIKSS